jgi:hypothetical protein
MVMVVTLATPAAAGSGSDAKVESTAEMFIGLVREAWDEDPSLVALRARDQGYDLEQTLEAVGDEEQELVADGTITKKGLPVAPAGPAAGVLEDEGEDAVLDAIDETGKLLAKKKSLEPPKEYLDDGTFVLIILLGLMAEGYTNEQIIVDGLLAGGIDAKLYAPIRIVDEKGRVIEPGDQPVEEPYVENVIADMVTIVEGYDPQDPRYEAEYDVKYTATLVMADATAKVTAQGTLGTDPSGVVYLGRTKGKMAIPATDECAAETVQVVITLKGDVPKSGRETVLEQSWGYRGSSGGGGEGFCIAAAEAPQLVELIPGLIGSFSGVVEPGAKLKSFLGNATLAIAAKR